MRAIRGLIPCRSWPPLSLCRGRGFSGTGSGLHIRITLAFLSQNGDGGVDLHALTAGLDQQLGDNAFLDSFHFHGGLVGLDLGDDIARFYRIAFLDEPACKRALLHGGREGGHENFDGHVSCSLALRVYQHVGVELGRVWLRAVLGQIRPMPGRYP